MKHRFAESVPVGDLSPVNIGAFSNVQDRAVISTALSTAEQSGAVNIGNYVTIGHGALLHACTVEDLAMIGMGAIVQEGAVVGKNAIVAAGSVVEPFTKIPSGQMWAGNPAVFKRDVNDRELEFAIPAAKQYNMVASEHKDEFLPEGTQFREAEALAKK
jgi:carbonic anhydrase/acetyltransferase-like protein (isoleucine patch superfamily)